MNLNNPKADAYLAKLANEMEKKIRTSSNSDEIFETLNLLEEFVYKVPEQTVRIVEYLIKHSIEAKSIKSPMGNFYGKSYSMIISKTLELLDRLRYICPDSVLPLLEELILKEDKEERSRSIEILKRFAKYDFNVLTKSEIGYGAQRKILDYILPWSIKERNDNFDFIKAVAEELLNPSVEGITSGINEEAQYTITFHSGVVDPTDFLKKIRRETIDLVAGIYKETDDEVTKLKIVNILDEATRGPISVTYDKNVEKMIADDTKYLMSIFREMLFDEKGNLVGSIPVAEAIENRLYWFNKNNKRASSLGSKKLREDILSDHFYSLFYLFVGDGIVFGQEEDCNAQIERKKQINKKIKEINKSSLSEWAGVIDKIARQIGLVEEWKFNPFNDFLRKLSAEKPDMASIILNNLMNNDKLANVLTSFLDGFRYSRRFDLWDKATQKAIKKKNVFLTNAIIYSLDFNRGGSTDQKLRNDDVLLIGNIVKQSGKFSFLKKNKESALILQHATINTLISNLRNDSYRTEPLLIEEIKKNKENNFLVRGIEFGFRKNDIDCNNISKELNDLLMELLVEIGDLDWNAQELLLNMGHQDIKIIFDVFWKRMEKDTKREIKSIEHRYINQYRAIPYHFNNNLKSYISSHDQFQTLVEEWINKTTPSFWKYNWDISRFLKAMGSPAIAILRSMIESGNEDDIAKAVHLIDRFEGCDIEMAIEVVRRTKEEKNISYVESMLFSTGVVSGEDGIACAFEEKSEKLKKYLNDENEQVKKFVQKMINDLEGSAKKERQNNEEEKQLRKIEFNE